MRVEIRNLGLSSANKDILSARQEVVVLHKDSLFKSLI